MSAISKKLRSFEYGPDRSGVSFWCPGCNSRHGVITDGAGAWGWNRNVDAPTFTPSVLVRCNMWTPPVTPENLAEWKKNPWEQKQVESVCHTFITDGRIQFLSDCTHALAGQTVDLPDFPEPKP